MKNLIKNKKGYVCTRLDMCIHNFVSTDILTNGFTTRSKIETCLLKVLGKSNETTKRHDKLEPSYRLCVFVICLMDRTDNRFLNCYV